MDADFHYKSLTFYIESLKTVRDGIVSQKEEIYDPIKAESLIQSYKYTIRVILQHCEHFMSKEKEDWSKLEEVSKINREYKKFLSAL